MSNLGVIAVEKSQDSKLGGMSATWASQKTCNPDCAHMHTIDPDTGKEIKGPCYYEHGNCNIHRIRLNREAAQHRLTRTQLARNEAKAIRGLTGKRRLRVHIGGDCHTNKAARIISNACRDHKAKHGQGANTYCHSWRTVDRASWQEVAVLASVETWDDVKRAHERGYASAIVVPEKHTGKKAYKVGEWTAVPCPQQTGAAPNCLACKLCFDDRALWQRKAVIAFQPDGKTQKLIKNNLIQIQGAN